MPSVNSQRLRSTAAGPALWSSMNSSRSSAVQGLYEISLMTTSKSLAAELEKRHRAAPTQEITRVNLWDILRSYKPLVRIFLLEKRSYHIHVRSLPEISDLG